MKKPRLCAVFVRHRYRDSNPGFRTENPGQRLRLLASGLRFPC